MADKSLTIRYAGDTSGVRKAHGELGAMHSALGSKLKSTGRSISAAGSTMTRGFTLPVVAGFGLAFKAASDLNESTSKVGVVFGKNADQIESWSSTAATSLGMSQQSALEAAGTFGNLFRAMEIGQGPTISMSKGIVGLSSDLASFNNADPTEVLEALRAGLVGETEPLRKFGINLSAARIEEEALRMGLAKQGAELSSAAKAQAAYSLIMQDSKLAQGDFARTADGAANQMRILKAQAIDAAAGLGNVLLPVGQKLIGWISGLVGWFQNLSPAWKEFAVIALGVAAALGPVLIVFGKIVSAIGVLIPVVKALWAVLAANPWVLIAAAVIALVIIIIRNWDKIKAFLLAVWAAIKAAALAVWNAIKAALVGVFNAIKAAVTAYFNAYKTVILAAWRAIAAVTKAVWNAIRTAVIAVWNALKAAAVAIFNALKAAVQSAWNAIKTVITTIARAVKDTVVSAWRSLQQTIGAIWDAVRSKVSAVWSGISNAIGSVIDFIASKIDWLASKVEWVMDKISGIDIPGWVPGFARGTTFAPGGMAIVGERGPELVDLPRGSRVHNASRTRQMAGHVSPMGGGAQRVEIRLDRRRWARSLEVDYVSRGW